MNVNLLMISQKLKLSIGWTSRENEEKREFRQPEITTNRDKLCCESKIAPYEEIPCKFMEHGIRGVLKPG